MKTRTWILIFALIGLICILCTIFFFTEEEKNTALVYSGGVLVQTIDLSIDGQYRIGNAHEWNILLVENGTVQVVDASCNNHDCISHGARNHGAPIVCLPNRLVIEFTDQQDLDAILR